MYIIDASNYIHVCASVCSLSFPGIGVIRSRFVKEKKTQKTERKDQNQNQTDPIFFCSVGKNIHAHLGDAVTVDQWNH